MIKGRNAWLTLLFLGLWTLGQLQRIQLTPNLVVYGHDFLIAGFLLLNAPALWTIIRTQTSTGYTFLKQHPLIVFTVGWVAFGWLVAGIQGTPLLIPLLYTARLAYYVAFGLSVMVLKPWAKADWRCLWLAAGLFFGWLAGLQFVFLPDTRWLAALGWDPHYYRLIGSIMDPGFAGMILVLTFILWQWRVVRFAWHWRAAVNILLALGVYATYSRATYLAFGTALVGLALWAGGRTRHYMIRAGGYLALGVLVAACVLFVPKPSGEGGNLTRTSTITARLDTSSQALGQLQPSDWLLGHGLFIDSQPPVVQTELSLPDHARVPDNFLVTTVTGTGIVGLALLSWWLFKIARYLWQVDQLFLIQLAALLVHALFNNTLLEPFIFLWIVGMATTIGKKP